MTPIKGTTITGTTNPFFTESQISSATRETEVDLESGGHKVTPSEIDGFVKYYSNLSRKCEKIELENQGLTQQINNLRKPTKDVIGKELNKEEITKLNNKIKENVLTLQRLNTELSYLKNILDSKTEGKSFVSVLSEERKNYEASINEISKKSVHEIKEYYEMVAENLIIGFEAVDSLYSALAQAIISKEEESSAQENTFLYGISTVSMAPAMVTLANKLRKNPHAHHSKIYDFLVMLRPVMDFVVASLRQNNITSNDTNNGLLLALSIISFCREASAFCTAKNEKERYVHGSNMAGTVCSISSRILNLFEIKYAPFISGGFGFACYLYALANNNSTFGSESDSEKDLSHYHKMEDSIPPALDMV